MGEPANEGQAAAEGGGKLKWVLIAVFVAVVALVALALLADQFEPMPMQYEGF